MIGSLRIGRRSYVAKKCEWTQPAIGERIADASRVQYGSLVLLSMGHGACRQHAVELSASWIQQGGF